MKREETNVKIRKPSAQSNVKLTLVAKGRADHGQGTNGEGTDLLEGLPAQPSFDLLLPLLACGSIGILSGRARIFLRHICNTGPTYYSYTVGSISGTTLSLHLASRL